MTWRLSGVVLVGILQTWKESENLWPLFEPWSSIPQVGDFSSQIERGRELQWICKQVRQSLVLLLNSVEVESIYRWSMYNATESFKLPMDLPRFGLQLTGPKLSALSFCRVCTWDMQRSFFNPPLRSTACAATLGSFERAAFCIGTTLR